MTLSEPQLWALLLIVPALVSGVVSSTVAFLLAKQKREAVFVSFGWFALTLTGYGLVDGVLSWSRPDLTSTGFVALGFLDLTLMGALVWRLADLGAELLGRPLGQVSRVVFLAPLAGAVGMVCVVALTLDSWSTAGVLQVGQVFLLLLFFTAGYWGCALVLGWRHIHDRVFRRILVATGILLLAFVPLWLWDAFARGGHYSFYWFFLCWNLGALALASTAFFDPSVPPPTDALFAPEGLALCANRFGLTPREAEIADLHAQGYSAKDIGAKLFIAPKTVRNHICNLYQKTGTGQRRELLELLRSSR